MLKIGPCLLCLTLAGSAHAAGKPEISAAMIAANTRAQEAMVQQRRYVADMSALGRKIFFDPRLSASGQLACATCHSPDHAYGPPNDLSLQLGGIDMKQPGTRAVPSLRYVQTVPAFTEHHSEEEVNGGQDNGTTGGPTGGHTWDGKANTLHEQALTPLLAAHEMANGTRKHLAGRLLQSGYADDMRRLFGENLLKNPEKIVDQATLALEIFQQSPAEFYPYSSKFDAFIAGKAQLSATELRGYALFNDPNKGNCMSCHPSLMLGGRYPQFTDYGYGNLGVPRNRAIPANADTQHFDLGLCDRKELSDHQEYCGLFKVPSLRNVATRHSFFHNGVFHSLEQVLDFYATRDTQPQRWYARDFDGKTRKFDDLPAEYTANVHQDVPFGLHPGDPPRFGAGDIEDLIAFLNTLSDGYSSGMKAR